LWCDYLVQKEKRVYYASSVVKDLDSVMDDLRYNVFRSISAAEEKLAKKYSLEIDDFKDDVLHFPNSDINRDFFIEEDETDDKEGNLVWLENINNSVSREKKYRFIHDVTFKSLMDYKIEHSYNVTSTALIDLDYSLEDKLKDLDESEHVYINNDIERLLNKFIGLQELEANNLNEKLKSIDFGNNRAEDEFHSAFDHYLYKISRYTHCLDRVSKALDDPDAGLREIHNSIASEVTFMESLMKIRSDN